MITRPFPPRLLSLIEVKHNLWEARKDCEYFHASEDEQLVRDEVFKVICGSLDSLPCDSTIILKSRVPPELRADTAAFYRKAIDTHFNSVLFDKLRGCKTVIVVCDSMPIDGEKPNSQRVKGLQKAIKLTLGKWANRNGTYYNIAWYPSKSDLLLQVTDYINWAIYRKWESGGKDLRSYGLIQKCVRTEFEATLE
jgi:hypothetical protein